LTQLENAVQRVWVAKGGQVLHQSGEDRTHQTVPCPCDADNGLGIYRVGRIVLDDDDFGLTMSDNLPVMTAKGRTALVRGSSRLWDVAA